MLIINHHNTTKACEEYKVISRALYEKAPTIEALVEKRKWIKTIPAKLEEFSVSIIVLTRKMAVVGAITLDKQIYYILTI